MPEARTLRHFLSRWTNTLCATTLGARSNWGSNLRPQARQTMRNKRSEVGLKSGKPVANSGPVLRRPTPPATAGRNPEACSSPAQSKSWPGYGAGSPVESAGSEAPALEPDDAAVNTLLEFFQILDEWDREG